MTIDPDGRRVLVMQFGFTTFLLSVDGDEPRNLFGFPDNDRLYAGGFSPSGRLVAAASGISDSQGTLRVWDLQTDEVQILEQPKDPDAWKGYFAIFLFFANETTLYTSGANGLLRWDIETGVYEQVFRAPPGGMVGMSLSSDRRTMLTYDIGPTFARIPGSVNIRDLTTGLVRSLEIPGEGLLGLSPDGTIWVSGEQDGAIGVGRADGGEPHLLLGQTGQMTYPPAISPDLQWIASTGMDGTFRLWPMPDLSKPPLHTLPHDELIAKLKTLTNLRVVRDEESPTGWKLEVGPFPGWETVPKW